MNVSASRRNGAESVDQKKTSLGGSGSSEQGHGGGSNQSIVSFYCTKFQDCLIHYSAISASSAAPVFSLVDLVFFFFFLLDFLLAADRTDWKKETS